MENLNLPDQGFFQGMGMKSLVHKSVHLDNLPIQQLFV